MSQGSRSSYKNSTDFYKDFSSRNRDVRARSFEARSHRVREEREKVKSGTSDFKAEEAKRKEEEVFSESSIKLGITKPADGVERVHIILIDNSGSNRKIADKLKASSGYFTQIFNLLDSQSQIAFIYFSDHCDGSRLMQEIDFHFPDEEGDKILHSTSRRIDPAHGGDAPEAIECALWRACEIDFNQAKERHIYLVTDVVAHGMGWYADDGCPLQRDWRDSLDKVSEIYNSFVVVGCSTNKEMINLQKEFINHSDPQRLAYDFLDLSGIKEMKHRLGIVANAILFLVARSLGMQAVELFLGFLYEKWLKEPIFGVHSDDKAREAIVRFMKFLEISDEEKEKLKDKVFC